MEFSFSHTEGFEFQDTRNDRFLGYLREINFSNKAGHQRLKHMQKLVIIFF